MSPNRFALNALNEEWLHLAASPAARRQLRSWSDRLPDGSPLGSLDDLVLAIQRGQLDESTHLVWSLLGLADSDQLARRVLLQAIVPGLMGEVRQLTGWALRTDVSLVDGGDVDQIVVTAAVEAIAHAVGHRRAWPIASILRRTHRLVVREARAVDRWYSRVLLDDAPDRAAVEADPMEADPRRELRQLLLTAATAGLLTSSDVQLV